MSEYIPEADDANAIQREKTKQNRTAPHSNLQEPKMYPSTAICLLICLAVHTSQISVSTTTTGTKMGLRRLHPLNPNACRYRSPH